MKVSDKMKFVHIADIHFDRPFINLSDKENLGDLRRLEQREVFKNVINYIKEKNIELLLISGDLYEHKYVKKSTIEFINNLFKEIPNTQIFISPGNHDPFLKNSYYNTFKWNSNVKIFNNQLEKYSFKEIDIYGYGFDDFYCKGVNLKDFYIEDENKINILIMHGSLDATTEYENVYNPIKRKELQDINFDYVALGHIHKINYGKQETERLVYPGSLVALGFDEPGAHGMMVGSIEKEKIDMDFIPLDKKEFIIYEIDVTTYNYIEELIGDINNINFEEKYLVEVVLNGRRNFEINIYELYKLISNNQIIKIKNNTKINYDLQKIKNTTTLKGIFTKLMLEKLNNENISEEEKEKIEKAIEIGYEAME